MLSKSLGVFYFLFLEVVVASSPIQAVRQFSPLSFNKPVFLTHAVGVSKQLFIVEQDGKVWNFSSDSKSDFKIEKPKLFLDLDNRVLSPARGGGPEEGLLGLAFAPDFKATREFYVYYSAQNPRRSVISRWRAQSLNPLVCDLKSEQIILEVPQPYSNHNGGMITFGPDKMLYVGLGDGGSRDDPENRAQNGSELLGKMLRIDVKNQKTYQIPHDNPFVQNKKMRGEIWALGLRNPWRFSFDRLTGDLWAGDVGQDKWEEINLIQKGGNYGWRCQEGKNPYLCPISSQFILPIVDYPHSSEGGISVTGGYVYRGKEIPHLKGSYIYGDFGSGHVWALQRDKNKVRNLKKILEVPMISSFGEDEEGELYILSYQNGFIYSIRP